MKTKRKISCEYGKIFFTTTCVIHLSYLTETKNVFLTDFVGARPILRILLSYTRLY